MGDIDILARQQSKTGVENCDAGAKSLERLRQLAGDWTTTDHRHLRWQTAQIEDRLTGMKLCSIKPGNCRYRRPSACGYHCPGKSQDPTCHFNSVWRGESCLSKVDVNSILLTKSVDRVVETDSGPQPSHPIHGGGEVDPRRSRFNVQTEVTRHPRIVNSTGRPDQSFGWHTTGVEAITAKKSALNQRRATTKQTTSTSTDKARRSRTKNDQVVTLPAIHPRRILIVTRMAVVDQALIVEASRIEQMVVPLMNRLGIV